MDQNQNDAKQQIVERLKDAVNVLVTVSANPTVDQLSAAIGLTLLLNKLGKHATAVFSGDPPSTLEFLEPEHTLEKNTDSLRDFIIALDKSKADKLRYKVEEQVVKIFITPYRTSLSQKDLEFSQGDFNVDVVIALGAQAQEELDEAVISQARILHDATVISISTNVGSSVGSINWSDEVASSVCEMLVFLGDALKSEFLDEQMATAFLTGIVAETDRFSNDKTTPRAMTIAGRLMTAGANQQLISSKLDEQETIGSDNNRDSAGDSDDSESQPTDNEQEDKNAESEDVDSDGTLNITHEGKEHSADDPEKKTGAVQEDKPELDPINIDENGTLHYVNELHGDAQAVTEETKEPVKKGSSKLITEPPQHGGTLTANTEPDQDDGGTSDALSLPPIDTEDKPLLSHDLPADEDTQTTQENIEPADNQTLSEIEKNVESPHLEAEPAEAKSNEEKFPDSEAARKAVDQAQAASLETEALDEALERTGSIPVDLDLGHGEADSGKLGLEYEPSPSEVPASEQPSQVFQTEATPADMLEPLPQGSPKLEPVDSDATTSLAPPPAVPPPPFDPSGLIPVSPLPPASNKDDNSPTSPPPPVPPPPMMPPPSGGSSDPMASGSNPFVLPSSS